MKCGLLILCKIDRDFGIKPGKTVGSRCYILLGNSSVLSKGHKKTWKDTMIIP